MAIEEAFNTAIEKGKVTEQAPSQPEGKPTEVTPESTAPQTGKAETQPQVPSTTAPTTDKPVWDGDVNKLPPELQEWAKAAQRHLTQRAMTDADLRRKGEEYDKFVTGDTYKQFQAFLNQQQNPQQVQKPSKQPEGISAQEWEEAQLDVTGTKFNNLLQKEVQRQLNEAASIYANELNTLKSTQQVTQFQTALTDFADIHPDIVELHSLGIMKPLLDYEFKNGGPKTYEEAINAAYERGSKIRQNAEEKALQKHQGRVIEKKEAVTSTGLSTGETNVVFADPGDAFNQAFEFAAQNKKVKVKTKR